MANSPSIVIASLSDDQLKKSIESLVTHVDEAMKKMVQSTNNAVGEMEAKLKSLGNLKIDSGGSADGGASKRAKAQNAETEAIEKNIAARDRQIKKNQESAMTFDQEANAITRAARSASTFIQSERESLRMRQNEIQAKIDSLRKQFGNVEIKTIVRDDVTFSRAVDKAKQKIEEIRSQLQNVPPTSSLGKQFSQELQVARNEYNELIRSRKAFEAQSQITRLSDEYEQNNKKIRELATAYKQIYTDSKQAESAINSGTNAIARYGDNVEKAQQKMLKAAFNRAINILPQGDDLAYAKLERLKAILADHRFLGALSPAEIKRARTEVQNLEQAIGQISTTQQQTTQSAQRYTEEIRKQAQAIRESKQWKEKGYYTIWTDKETNTFASVNANDRRSIEEQLLAIYKAEEGTVSQLVLLESSQNASAKERLGTEQAITQEQEKRKKYVSPTINDDAYQIARNAIARKLGIDASKVINADAQYDSIKRVGDALKQLQDAYTRMTNEERNSPIGKQMVRQMQELQRQSQQLRAQMSRPLSLKDALSGSEKTLDDIAYKIRRLQSYMQGLDTSNEKSAAEFQRAAIYANLLKEKQNQLLQKNSQLIRSNGELFASNTALGRSWNYMKNRLAFYFTVGAGTQFVKQLVDIRSQYEMNERALGILINSAERGTQIFNELSQMALVSPYTLIELSNAAKQLTAYDIAAKDVVDTTRRLADMASAVGVPMERLTYALGQIKAYGYLNSRDNRMFANAGIPLVKQLSDYYTELEGKLVSTADVYDRIKNKAVSFEDTMGVIYKMTDEGGKFFDFQEKMAGTLKVQLANLNLAWNNMLNDIGSESQGVLTAGIGALKELFLAWKDVEKVLTQIIVAFGVVKGVQMLSTVAIGKQTIKTLEYVSANKLATASEYKRALSINGLTAEQARWLILTNQSNTALVTAITRMGVLDKAVVRYLATLSGFRKGLALLLLSGKMAISGLVTGFKTLGTAILSNWPMVLLMAGMDLFMHMNQVAENNKELNKTIADGAKEATKALNDFLTAEDKVQIRLDAQNKKLTKAQGEKAWESIREQIELSAMSAKQIIPELLDIPDINERITKSFELAERIQKATEALQGLEDELEVSQDSWFGGAFGEGLEEDVEDFVESVKNRDKKGDQGGYWDRFFYGPEGGKDRVKADIEEAKSEIEKFAADAAEIIKERLGEEGVSDPVQVKEAVERLIKETEAKFPRITRGAGKKLFEAIVGDTMGEQFKGVYDTQEQYYKMFLEQLGKDYGSKFRDVTEDIKKDTFDWSEAQEDAINKTAEKIKQDLPEASQEAINQILKQLNTTEFKMRIVAEFATKDNDDVQKAFDRDFYDRETLTLPDEQREKKRAENVQKYQAFRIKAGEDTVEYEKRISDEREKQEKLAKETQAIIDKGGDSAVLARAKEENKAANQWLANMKEVEKWGGYDFSKDNKGGKDSKKDPLLDALKQEISLVEKLQGDYDKLSKSGASQSDALETIRGAYGKTIRLLNAQLQSYGLPQINISQLITGKDPHKALEHFKQTLDTLVSKGLLTFERSKELEAVVEKFTLSAKTYDLDMITKGLNNELGKLKDEYELAVELDANPEMGNLFADWMGIDMSNLPHTAEEYAKRRTKALNKYLADEKSGIEIGDLLALTDDDLRMFQQRVDDGELTQVWVDNIVKNTKEARNALKKEYGNIAKEWDNLVQKYSEYEYKIAQIQRNANKERKVFALKYGTDDQKERALTLTTEIDAEEDPQKRAELIQELKDLVANIAGDDKAKLKITAAIDKKENKETAKTIFENLKESGDYERFFNSINTLTLDSAIKIKGEIRKGLVAAFKDGALSVSQFKKEIKALEDQFDKLTQNNQNWFVYMKDGFNGLIQKAKETGNEIEALGAKMGKEGKVDKKDQEYLDSFGKIFWGKDGGKGGLKNFSSLMKEFGNDFEGLGKQTAAAGQNMQGAASDFQGAVAIVDMIIKNIHQTVQAIGSVIEELDSMRSEDNKISNSYWQNFQKYDNYASSGWENLKSGNIGGALGDTANSFIVLYRQISKFDRKQEKINKSIKESQREVKNLELAYKDLQDAINNSYGAQKWAAQQMAQANKELQLAELKRQLQLEESRKSKIRDIDKIQELRGQIKDLELEIKNSTNEIVSDLLGISSVGDAAENLVLSMINAFRQGEDYMEEFDGAYENMINNMIAKTFASLIIGDKLQELWDSIKQKAEERAKGEKNIAMFWEQQLEEARNRKVTKEGAVQKKGEYSSEEEKQADLRRLEQQLEEARKAYADAIKPTPNDIKDATQQMEGWRDYAQETFLSVMEGLGITAGDQKESNLSALQQGIQGITEDTADAIEAYMNGVSQQVYYHSTLLEQIRDSVVGLDLDVSLGVQSQMLLQLQSSYQVQMSIQGILEGVLNPSGRAFTVELLS